MNDEEKYPSQLAERFQIRLPDGMRDRIRQAAEENGRSMNAEIVHRLEASFPQSDVMSRATPDEQKEILDAAVNLIKKLREGDLKRVQVKRNIDSTEN